MRRLQKVVSAILIVPVLIVLTYFGFLWITYIDDTVVSGSKYGLSIGATKLQTYKDISTIQKSYPKLKIYISYGERAGDNMTLSPTMDSFKKIEKYDRWDLLLDGEGEFFNVIKLDYTNGALVGIYRHRKYFEAP